MTIQIDVGFGDAVTPAASRIEYPTLFDMPAPRLRGYTRETTIAEKFQAMVKLDVLNSRMKDFYDVWLLARHFDIRGETLSEAIRTTFRNRNTKIPATPISFSVTFADDPVKAVQWAAFVRKSRLPGAPATFKRAVAVIATFLGPVARALAEGKPFQGTWHAPGPWG